MPPRTRFLAAAAVLALLAAAAETASPPPPSAFPGPVQPDPGALPAASRNGKAVAFEASVRDAGERWDPAAEPTVLLWDRRVGTLRQLTASSCDQPAVENGTFWLKVGTSTTREIRARTLVAFRSSADLAGRNGDGSPEIFLWDSRTGGFTQITDSLEGESSRPVLGARFTALRDADGLFTGAVEVRYRVAFLSTSDLTGNNPSGLPQVFLHDSGLPEVQRPTQVSHGTTGAAGPPALDGRGRRVAFVHDGDLLPGPDAAGTPAVYTWKLGRGLRRVAGEAGLSAGAAEPVLDSSGRFVAWTALSDPAGRRGVVVGPARGGRLRSFFPGAGDHRAPALGRGRRRFAALSTEAGGGGGVVGERPVLLGGRRGPEDLGLPAGGTWGPPRMQWDRSLFFVTSDGDLDGTNGAGREVLWLVPTGR